MTYRVIGLIQFEFLPLLNAFLLVSQCFCFLNYKYRVAARQKYFRPAVRILKLSKSFKILLIERAVGFLPPAHTPRCSVPDIFCEVF